MLFMFKNSRKIPQCLRYCFIALCLLSNKTLLCEEQETIVILVDGTINVQELRDNPFLLYARKMDMKDAYYYKTKDLRYSIQHPQAFMTNTPDLVEISLSDNPKNTSELIVSLFASSWKSVSPYEKNKKKYYVYNWLGVLSERVRQKAGRRLYTIISELVQGYINKGFSIPRIYLIGFSHGGNVILHMAEEANNREKHLFSIDTAVLLATPIHEKSIKNAQSSFFKTVYSIVSPGDWVQGFDLSTPGYHITTGNRLLKTERPIYEFSVSLFLKEKLMAYGHAELGHVCWNKIDDIKVPLLVFLPFLTEYGALVTPRQQHECTLRVTDKTCIMVNNTTYCSGSDIYQRFLAEIKKFGSDYGLFERARRRRE